jgi:hypothetical protein
VAWLFYFINEKYPFFIKAAFIFSARYQGGLRRWSSNLYNSGFILLAGHLKYYYASLRRTLVLSAKSGAFLL